jgi:hypothetical protein
MHKPKEPADANEQELAITARWSAGDVFCHCSSTGASSVQVSIGGEIVSKIRLIGE